MRSICHSSYFIRHIKSVAEQMIIIIRENHTRVQKGYKMIYEFNIQIVQAKFVFKIFKWPYIFFIQNKILHFQR